MATTARLDNDKGTTVELPTVQQLFKEGFKATDEINATSFIRGLTNRRLQVDLMAQGSEFYRTFTC